MSDGKRNEGFVERICPMCGKKFFPPSLQQWTYKINWVCYCSWGCLQKKRAPQEARHRAAIRKAIEEAAAKKPRGKRGETEVET